MGVFHLEINPIGRGAKAKQRSGYRVVAAAAYRSGQTLTDAHYGMKHRYGHRKDVAVSEMLVPEDAPEWAQDRETFWNSVESHETLSTARLARDLVVSLPHQLEAPQRRSLALEFGMWLRDRYHTVVDVNVHDPPESGDDRNFHAHLLMATRSVDAEGFGKKLRVLDARATGPQEVRIIRETWAELANAALAAAGVDDRIDHRSHRERGLQAVPQIKMGKAAFHMERRGIKTRVGDINRHIQATNDHLSQP